MIMMSQALISFLLLVSVSCARKPNHRLHITSKQGEWCKLPPNVEHARAPDCLKNTLKNFFVADEYVIILKDTLTTEEAKEHINAVKDVLDSTTEKIIDTFFISEKFKGYGAKLTQKTLEERLKDTNFVNYIECNLLAESGTCITQDNSEWGLKRTIGAKPSNTQDYVYDDLYAGDQVDAYIVDSGIDISIADFEERAILGADLVRNEECNDLNKDYWGHGTHVAGIVMSKTYGVAKKATAIAVKIFGPAGSTTTLDIIRALNFVATNAEQRKKKSVANMSLGSPHSQAVDDAVEAVINKNILVVTSAGNANCDACTTSPASAAMTTSVVTVMASNKEDEFASFSNYGKCTTIIAPGTYILSTLPLPKGQGLKHGTSMAAPFVTGVVAKYISTPGNPTPAEIKAWLLANSVKNKITNLPNDDTPNNLVYYKDC